MDILILQMWSEVPMWARFLAPVLYVAIGYHMAILSFVAYDKRNTSLEGGDAMVTDASKILLFPINTLTHGVYSSKNDFSLGIISVVRGSHKKEVLYVVLHMVVWLPRLVCNLGIVVLLVILSLIVFFGAILKALVADLFLVVTLLFRRIPSAHPIPTK